MKCDMGNCNNERNEKNIIKLYNFRTIKPIRIYCDDCYYFITEGVVN